MPSTDQRHLLIPPKSSVIHFFIKSMASTMIETDSKFKHELAKVSSLVTLIDCSTVSKRNVAFTRLLLRSSITLCITGIPSNPTKQKLDMKIVVYAETMLHVTLEIFLSIIGIVSLELLSSLIWRSKCNGTVKADRKY